MAVTINGTTGIVTPDIGVDGSTLVIDSANNRVGVLEDSPSNTLTVGDTVQPSYAPTRAGNYIEIARTSGADAGLLINKNTGQWLVGINNGDGANAPLRFEYAAAGSSHPGLGAGTLGMIIKHDGTVGIGTDNPSYKLQVENSGVALGRFLRTNAGAALFQIMSQDGGNITLGLGDVSDPDIQYIKSDNSDNSLSFGTNTGETLRITSTGNVAVNDTGNAGYTSFSPCIALGDSGDSKPALVIRGSATSVCDISFCDNSGTESEDGVSEGLIRYDHNTDHMEFHTADSEKLRINSTGTLESYSPDDTTPNFKFRSDDTNWFGALNQSVHGSTITTFLSCGGDWSANGTTYSATKALAAYPTSAIAIHNQYNNTWGSQFVFLTKAGGSTTTDGAVTERLRITSTGAIGIGTDNPVGSLEVRDSKANLIVAKDGLTVKSNSDLHTSYDTLQIGAGGALLSYSVATVTADTQFVHNAYRSSGGTFKYRYADTAARIRMNSPGGEIIFDNAASGSADADITFSEKLRITSSGNIWHPTGGNLFLGSTNLSDFTSAGIDNFNRIGIRAGSATAGTTPDPNNCAIKIYPANVRSTTTGTLSGGIAWQHLDPSHSTWDSAYGDGSQIWMGAALHDVPGQERDRFNLWMNSGTTGNSNPGNLAIEAYPSGVVRHPKVPAFMVRNSNNAGAFSAGAIATWNVTILNNGSHFASNKFTAPIDGIYHFNCMMLSQNNTRLFHEFRVNGTRVDGTRSESYQGTSYQTNTITMTYSLSANDYVEVYVGPNSGYGGPYTNFNGFLVG